MGCTSSQASSTDAEPVITTSKPASEPVQVSEIKAEIEKMEEKPAPASTEPSSSTHTMPVTMEEKVMEEIKAVETTHTPTHVEPTPEPAAEPSPSFTQEIEKAIETPVVQVEKVMSPMVTSTEVAMPKLKQGFISKEGQFLKNWNNRYFVLDNGELSYYEKPYNLPPYGINKKGSVPTLKGKTVMEEPDLMVKISGGEARDILLRFSDEQSKVEWVAAIKEHIAYADRT